MLKDNHRLSIELSLQRKKKADSGNIFVLLFESIGHLYVVSCKFQKRSTRSARIYVYARRETADSLERRAHLR